MPVTGAKAPLGDSPRREPASHPASEQSAPDRERCRVEHHEREATDRDQGVTDSVPPLLVVVVGEEGGQQQADERHEECQQDREDESRDVNVSAEAIEYPP